MILHSSAITLAVQNVRNADRHARAVDRKGQRLQYDHKAQRVSTEHYLVRTKRIAEELTRAVDVEHDALRDFYEAVMREVGQEPYESDDSEIADLLSLSAAGR